MDLFRLSHIITKYLKGQSSQEENSVLNEWKSKEDGNKRFIDDLHDEKTLAEGLNQYNTFDSEKAWHTFELRNGLKSATKHRVFSNFLKVAAVVALFLSVGVAIHWMRNVPNTQTLLAEQIIPPGSTQAILRVAEQGTIALADTVVASVKENEQVVAMVKDGQIIYGDAKQEPIEMAVEVPLQSEYQFVLSDGTKVWMNAGSKVRFQYPFSDDKREIYAEGEVYMEVMKDIKRPFLVSLPNENAIEVLGTEFNVRAYPDEIWQEAVLVEGSVLWRTNEGTERIMEPNQLLKLNTSTNELNVKMVDVYQYVAWKEGRFVFEGANLEDIMLSLSRWYGVEVDYQHEFVKDFHFSGDVRRYENLNEILAILELTEKIQFTINGSKILVSDRK